MSKKELLPCPFCGFQPDLDDPDTVYPLNREKTTWQVGCSTIAGGCDANVLGGTKESAIKAWNKRIIMEYMESKMQDQIEAGLNTYEEMSVRIMKLEELVKAVHVNGMGRIECKDVNNKNWFDLREEILKS